MLASVTYFTEGTAD